MNSSPFFSVIIPTYNRSALIEKTLRSVFGQTYKNYEIIVVDNGSTDNTLEILEPYQQSNKIKIIRNPVNQERSVSRNLGMQAAKGDYLTLLDSDDLMYSTNLADAAHYVSKNSKILFFHNLYHLVNTEGEVIYNYKFPNNHKAIKAISNGNFLSCIGIFLAKEIYDKYRFEANPIIIGSEDWELWMRIIAKYPLGRINKINNAIVHHPARSITSYTLENIIKRKKFIIYQIENNIELNNVYHKYIKNINSSVNLFAASIANSAGMYGEAKKYLKIAFATNPFLIFDVKFLRILQISMFKLKHKHNI